MNIIKINNIIFENQIETNFKFFKTSTLKYIKSLKKFKSILLKIAI